ncbi:hypothetical protein [Aeromonas jandaei]|uniref:hypothetical protein n=1 Tax=Aeromonas jandaei TaxID=650 RepID=UPI0012EC072A|nr:hypothetical protein [Aeromonas jandaei]
MVDTTASGRYPYRETALYRMPDSKYFTVITPYLSNVRLRFANRTYSSDFDLTAILASGKVVRIQVKETELNNKNTNNAIDRIDKQYDFLVVVIISEKRPLASSL